MSLAAVGDIAQGCDASDVTSAAGTELSLRASLSKRFLRKIDEEPTPALGRGLYGKSCFKEVSERGRCWQLILVSG